MPDEHALMAKAKLIRGQAKLFVQLQFVRQLCLASRRFKLVVGITLSLLCTFIWLSVGLMEARLYNRCTKQHSFFACRLSRFTIAARRERRKLYI
jgi:hypothetical protein